MLADGTAGPLIKVNQLLKKIKTWIKNAKCTNLQFVCKSTFCVYIYDLCRWSVLDEQLAYEFFEWTAIFDCLIIIAFFSIRTV